MIVSFLFLKVNPFVLDFIVRECNFLMQGNLSAIDQAEPFPSLEPGPVAHPSVCKALNCDYPGFA